MKKSFLLLLLLPICFFGQLKPIAPPYLKPGDTVGIVTTARKIDIAGIQAGIDLLKSWGLTVVVGKTIGKDENQLAGPDWFRATDLQQMLDDPKIKLIWSAKGGYGTVRIIDRIDWTKFKKHPKWIAGFSDCTVLHSHIQTLGFQTIHSFMALSAKSASAEAIQSFRTALFGGIRDYTIAPNSLNRTGFAEGIITGGNLSVLYSLMGSASEIDTKGKILFIEDLDEYLYHIDRMMMNLKRNGYFKNIKGLIVGGMTSMNDNDIPWGHTAEEIIKDIVKDYDFPVIFNFPAGHIKDNRTLVLGEMIRMEAENEKAEVQTLKK
ncbi:S66 peptidase family protein [Flavobacterium silvaticum]|uniref:LD-carboxypeptidase n=1 Tax=Flavobacterium silvaticum TaxID=1852020 RepID=A0A972FN37_9FLAO|nr:LD-carboxypeptidase [Flavobacterium silvaticum]NMH28285.1 LD-carboxypeptidase [Flavobacterium silvaticum]